MLKLDPVVALTRERFAVHRQPLALRESWLRAGYIDTSVVGARLISRLREAPSRTAVIEGVHVVTNGELLSSANSLAATFLAAGVGPGHVVSWQTPNWWESVVVALATWQIGAINNPIVTIYREHELREILHELRPSVVIAPREFRGIRHQELIDSALAQAGHEPVLRLGMRGGDSRWIDLAEVLDRRLATIAVPSEVVSDDPCVVAFTSGTTSGAKGVVLDSTALLAETRQMREVWGMSWNDTSFMPAPLAHLTGLIVGFTMPVTAGGVVALQDVWDPELAVELIEEHKCVISSGAPTFLTDLAAAYEASRFSHSHLAQYSVGGASVPPSLIDRAESLGIHAWRCYGMTEHMSTTITNRGAPLHIRRDTDGPISPGSDVSTADENGAELPAGVEGELRVRGPERMLGYLREEHNSESLDDKEGWFTTGDIGFVDDEGCVHVTGRRKDVINRGGEKMSAREIEEVVALHPAFHQAAIVPRPDARMGEVPAAFVVLTVGSELPDVVELNEFLTRQGLARQKTPVEWYVIDQMPTTPFGKIRKNALIDSLRS